MKKHIHSIAALTASLALLVAAPGRAHDDSDETLAAPRSESDDAAPTDDAGDEGDPGDDAESTSEAGAAAASDVGETPAERVEAPASEASSDAPIGVRIMPWVSTGVGAVAIVGGMTAAVVGALPVLEHQGVEADLVALESSGTADVAAMDSLRTRAYELDKDWRLYGGPLVGGGLALTIAGTALVAGGLYGALIQGGGEE